MGTYYIYVRDNTIEMSKNFSRSELANSLGGVNIHRGPKFYSPERFHNVNEVLAEFAGNRRKSVVVSDAKGQSRMRRQETSTSLLSNAQFIGMQENTLDDQYVDENDDGGAQQTHTVSNVVQVVGCKLCRKTGHTSKNCPREAAKMKRQSG